jgi:DNA-binding transcriptional MerR regulator
MEKTDKEFQELKKSIRELIKLDFITPDEIPGMELYMDQLTRYMDKHLGSTLRDESDKALTKTMINNYTKNKLIPPPEKKRYSRKHLILLIYIYYLKNVVSINDIRRILGPMTENDFAEDDVFEFYKSIFEMEKLQYFNTEAAVIKSSQIVDKKLQDDEDEYLKKMAFIYLLGYDIFMKKRLMEKLIDELPEE